METRFVDRATWWVQVGPGSAASWATLSALAIFTVIVLFGRHQADPNWLRFTGFGLTVLLSLLELSGPLTVAAGWFQLAQDPTAARSFWDDDLLTGSQLVLCLVLGVLASLLAVVLYSGAPAGEGTPQTDDTNESLPSTNENTGPTTAKDPHQVFRRPGH